MTTIAELARKTKKQPEQLLLACQRAGLDKQGVEDVLSKEETIRVVRFMGKGDRGAATVVKKAGPRVTQVELPRGNGPRGQRVKVTRIGNYESGRLQTDTPKPPAPPPVEVAPEPEVEVPEPPKPAAEPPAPAAEPKKDAPAAAPRGGRKARPRAKPKEDRDSRGKPAQGRGRREQLHIDDQRRPRKRRAKKRDPVEMENPHTFTEPTAAVVREVAVFGPMTVSELAMAMAVKATEVIKTLMELGEAATINDVLEPDTIELVVEQMGHKVQRVRAEDVESDLLVDCVPSGEPVTRPPVVAVMGHVDHGKTSLLDYLRKTRVAAGEAGGITQHIGAYQLDTPHGKITFLDTPGHAAFTAMRGRGAQCTDIVVLVVAADDGVKPQTEEAIQHARDAEVPIIVAINKIDRDNADPEQVRTALSSLGLQPEDWGGDTICVPVSAKTGEGIEALLEAISLQAEILDLKAAPEGAANGVVIESSLDRGRGTTATVLVQAGCLRQRDLLLCGQEYGRVKSMFDDSGQKVEQSGPSFPVLVLGLSGVPQAGDPMHVVADEQKAREVADYRKESARHRETDKPREEGLAWAEQLGEEKATVNLIIKTDVRGSAEALRDSLEKLATEDVEVKIVLLGIGGINESDALLADTSKSILLGFNVRANSAARRTITDRNLDLRYYNVIYELVDDVRELLEKQLAPDVREEIMGLAEVLEVFRSSKMGAVAGCRVAEGMVQRGYPIRVLRDNVVIYEGELESLRRHKDDVAEVQVGTECGIAVANYNDVQVGDQVEVYRRVETARTL